MQAWKAEVMKRKLTPSNIDTGACVASTAFLSPDIQEAYFKSWEVLSLKDAAVSERRVLQSSEIFDGLSLQPKVWRKSAPPNAVYIQKDL